MFRKLLLSAVLTVVLAGPSFAQSVDLRDLSVEQTVAVQSLPSRPGSLAADAWFDRANPVYIRGEAVRLFLRVNQDAYVTVLSIGPTGAVTQLFPNAFNPYNAVRGGSTVEIPGPGARAVVGGSLGPEVVKIVVTSGPARVIPESELGPSAPFRSVIGGVGAVARDLEVVAAPTAPGQNILIINKVFRSAPAAGAAFGSGAILIVPDSAPAPIPPRFFPLPALDPSASLGGGRLSGWTPFIIASEIAGAFPSAKDRDRIGRDLAIAPSHPAISSAPSTAATLS